MSDTLSITTYTPDPKSSNLQGYYLRDGTVTSMTCADTEELIATDGFPFCCTIKSSGQCYQATTCSQNTMVDRDKDTWVCDEGTECRPMTIYDSYRDSTEASSGTQFSCFQSWEPSVVYRNLPYTTTVSASTTGTQGAHTTTLSSSPSQTATVPPPTSTGTSSGRSSHTGAIAGGVVGGVAGLALIAAAAFLLLRRRTKRNNEMHEIGTEFAPHEREL